MLNSRRRSPRAGRQSARRRGPVEPLRAGTARRLAHRLGLPRSAGPETLVPAVARAAGWEDIAVASLLYHRSPTTSAELLDLSAALESLEREVHRHDR